MSSLPSLAILGTGSMGGAILAGLLQPGVTISGSLRVTTRSAAKAEALASDRVRSYSLEASPDANLAAVAGARLVILGVKPAMVPDLLRQIAPALEPDAIVVSIAAGVTIETIETLVPSVVLRAMPNTPALIGRAVTGLAAGGRATESDIALTRTLFETVGEVLEVPESKIDALTAVSGSGPAYVFYLIEQLTRTAVDLGFSESEAAIMVGETFAGAAELLRVSGVEPSELRRRVTSPGGTTERAIAVLESGDLKHLFDQATASALARASELAAGG